MKMMTVRVYCALNGLEVSYGEKVIIQAMMRIEAEENDVSTSLNNDVMEFPERMLDMFFNE